MGTTSKMSIPYPESTDYVADGATAMENLADEVDAKTGLVFITSQTVTSTPSTIVFTAVFDAAKFVNYRIVGSNLKASTGASITLRMGSATTNYYGGAKSFVYTGTESFTGITAGAHWIISDITTNPCSLAVDLMSPDEATRTHFNGMAEIGGIGIFSNGMLPNTTTYNDCTFGLSTGGATFTSGTISVYGYNI